MEPKRVLPGTKKGHPMGTAVFFKINFFKSVRKHIVGPGVNDPKHNLDFITCTMAHFKVNVPLNSCLSVTQHLPCTLKLYMFWDHLSHGWFFDRELRNLTVTRNDNQILYISGNPQAISTPLHSSQRTLTLHQYPLYIALLLLFTAAL